MIFKSPHPDVAIPNVALTDFVFGGKDRLRDKTAIVEAASGRSYTYGELHDAVRRFGVGLSLRGFARETCWRSCRPTCPRIRSRFTASRRPVESRPR